MQVPRHVVDTLDLLPRLERQRLLRSIEQLRQAEQELPSGRIRFAKLVQPNLFIFRGSGHLYRVLFEIVDGEIRVTDIVHRDKIRLVVLKRGRFA